MNELELQALTFDQVVAVDNYKNASKEALGAVNSVADKIVTAAFSVATALGAVIALVAPEETPSPIEIGIPFLFLAGAVGAALFAQSIGIDLAGGEAIDKLHKTVKDTVKRKRKWSRVALLSLAIGMLAAGILVREAYAEPAESEPVSVRLWLHKTGIESLASTCSTPSGRSIRGTVKTIDDLEKRSIPIEVTKKACASGAGTLVFRRMQILTAKQ